MHARELLQCQTEEKYDAKFVTLKPLWSKEYVMYFDRCVLPRIKKAGCWYLNSIGIEANIMTTNMSESFNATLKRYQDWEEVTPDIMIFTLFKIQNVVLSEIDSSLNGFGPYSLTQGTVKADAVLKKSEVCTDLNTIMDEVRDRLKGYKNLENIPPIVDALASDFVVTHVPLKATFLVSRANGPVYVVTLFPKETCTCPSTSSCCHAVAAKRSIGIEAGQRKKINLTELQKKLRYIW